MALTKKQIDFVKVYYIMNRNASAAYRSVYKHVSEGSARRLASKLLSNVDIQALMAEREKEIAKKYEIKTEDLVRELQFVISSSKKDMDIIDRNSICKAVDLLAKLSGAYAPQQIENKIKFDNVKITLNKDENKKSK